MGKKSDIYNEQVQPMMTKILAICKEHDIPNGFWHTTMDNVERLVADGYRYLMAGPSRSFNVVNKGREASGRS